MKIHIYFFVIIPLVAVLADNDSATNGLVVTTLRTKLETCVEKERHNVIGALAKVQASEKDEAFKILEKCLATEKDPNCRAEALAAAFKLDKKHRVFGRMLTKAMSGKDERVHVLAKDIQNYLRTGDESALKRYER